jgi:hypothetical protein
MKASSKYSDIGIAALTYLLPVPGVSLLFNKRLRRNARRATGIALLGAGALIAVPVALYVICKTSPESNRSN